MGDRGKEARGRFGGQAWGTSRASCAEKRLSQKPRAHRGMHLTTAGRTKRNRGQNIFKIMKKGPSVLESLFKENPNMNKGG